MKFLNIYAITTTKNFWDINIVSFANKDLVKKAYLFFLLRFLDGFIDMLSTFPTKSFLLYSTILKTFLLIFPFSVITQTIRTYKVYAY